MPCGRRVGGRPVQGEPPNRGCWRGTQPLHELLVDPLRTVTASWEQALARLFERRRREDDAVAVQVQRAHSRKQRVDCKGHQRPQKCFPNLASFRQVDAESEIVFSKKGESFQESQGILSPLRLPVPPRPLWSPDQILSAFSGGME